MTHRERLETLITQGEDLKQRLLPTWAEYRQFMLESARFNRDFAGVARIDLDELHSPDIDHVLDLLREHGNQMDRADEYKRRLGLNTE
jgi:hypothetical protein